MDIEVQAPKKDPYRCGRNVFGHHSDLVFCYKYPISVNFGQTELLTPQLEVTSSIGPSQTFWVNATFVIPVASMPPNKKNWGNGWLTNQGKEKDNFCKEKI